MKPIFRLRNSLAVLAVTMSAASSASGQTWAWTGTAGGTWGDVTKWTTTPSPNSVPNATGAAVTISTNITATQTVTIDGSSRTVGTLVIGDATTRSSAFNLAADAGLSLILDNGASGTASITSSTASFSQTISAPILLRSDTTNFINNTNDGSTARVQTYSGNIASDTNTTKSLVVSGASIRANVTISGVISNPTGTLSLTKSGANILILSGANTYSGGTTLTAGSLLLNHATAIGSGALTINGGTLGTTSATAITLSTNNAQTWGGDFGVVGSQTLNMGTGAVTMTGNRSIALTGSGAAGSAAKLVVGGVISDGGNAYSLTTTALNGVGAALELAGTNTYTGGTNINGGLVRFASTAAVPATGTITIGSAGSLAVGGAYDTLAGWVGSGKLAAGSTGSLALESSSAENWNPGGSGFNGLSLGAALGSTVVYTGTISPVGGSYLIGGGGGSIEFANANALAGDNAVIVGGGGGGRTVLSTANSFTGQTTVRAGTTLVLSNSGALGTAAGGTTVAAAGGIELRGGITINDGLSVAGTGSTASPTNVISSLTSAAGVNEWAGDITASTTNNVRFTAASGATLRLSGDVALSGSGSMVLTGAGTGLVSGDISGDVSGTAPQYAIIQNNGSNWTLSGNNTFVDGVRIDNGSISVASIATNLGNSTSAIGLGETTGTGRLIYTGTGETTERGFILRSDETSGAGGGVIEQAGTGLLKINGSVTSAATASAKTFSLQGSTTGTGEIAGVIANSSSGLTNLSKSGSGTWTVSGVNTYTGTTTVSGGTLIAGVNTVANSGINSSSGIVVGAGARFALGKSDVVGNSASMTLNGGTFDARGNSETLGALILTSTNTLALDEGANVIRFASLSTTTGILNITGWSGSTEGGGTDQIFFGSSSSGLTTQQLAAIRFIDPNGVGGTYGAEILGTGEIVALIPEPSVIGLALIAGAGLVLRRKRVA